MRYVPAVVFGVVVALGASLATGAGAGSSASAEAGAAANARGSGTALGANTRIHATLDSRVSASQSEVGDRVNATVTQAVRSGKEVVLPKGAKLVGQVTRAEAGAKGRSELGLRFDRAVLADGREIPADVAIQAIAAARGKSTSADSAAGRNGSASAPASGSGSSSSGKGLLGGAGDAVGGLVKGTTQGAAALTASTTGVVGIPGLALSSDAESSLLVSSGKDVQLQGGTQMVLRVREE